MNNFGYSISPSSTINLDNFNPKLFKLLQEAEPDVNICMACGSCAASCTAGNYTSMNLRRVILFLGTGRDKEAIEEISSCMLCGKCTIVCPRGINTRHLILSICKIYNIENK